VPEYETIRYGEAGGVGKLTLARPAKRNAQNPRMWAELRDLGAELRAHGPLHGLVVAGDGPVFSAGIDLVEGLGNLADLAGRPAAGDEIGLGLQTVRSFSWIGKLGCPSVALVQGHAYGAGLQLALTCDFRVFTETAQVGLTETRYGILPDMGAAWRLPHIVGDARAKEMMLLGRVIGAAEALRIGLANEVVADDALPRCVSEWTARLASLPPLAVAGAKRAIHAAWTLDEEAAETEAVRAQLRCLRSSDFQEALAAHAAGRRPVWTGQ
jgi:enoyl-CoA hydratase/carnithine racemase